MANGDLAARCNFATVDRNLRILDLRAGRIENTEILEQSLNAMKFEEPFIFKSATTYRAVLVLRSKNHNLSDRVSDIDPHGIGKRVKLATPLRKDAAYSAHLINSFLEKSHYLLEKHEFNKQRRRQSLPPANFLLLRGFGTQIPQLENFFDRFGLRACGISSIEVNVGILKMLGFDLTKVPEDIGNPDLELRAKIEPIENALADYDFVFAHFKTIDIPGHDGDLRRKIQEIERVDRFLGKLIPSLDTQNLTIVVTSDHGTSCYESGHSLDPIPTIVNGPKIAPERVKFGEQPCASTTLGRMPSYKLMEFVRERL
jgi:2,3-bisphosphoglycerate-independent phosphoglycerate mutase